MKEYLINKANELLDRADLLVDRMISNARNAEHQTKEVDFGSLGNHDTDEELKRCCTVSDVNKEEK